MTRIENGLYLHHGMLVTRWHLDTDGLDECFINGRMYHVICHI